MIKILKNPNTDNYKKLKEKVFSSSFPWSYEYGTNSGVIPHHEKFKDMPFYSHPIISRPFHKIPFPTPVSTEWELCVEVFKEIMSFNNKRYKTIYRMNLNSTFYVHDDYSPIHVDHDYPHDNMIVYLNSFSGGKTHVFHKKFPFPEQEILPSGLKFSHKGEEDDIITFDGLHYHCMECPPLGERRIILIVTYLT